MKGFLLKIKNDIKGIYSSIDDIIEFINEVVCLVDKPFNLSDIKITIYKNSVGGIVFINFILYTTTCPCGCFHI